MIRTSESGHWFAAECAPRVGFTESAREHRMRSGLLFAAVVGAFIAAPLNGPASAAWQRPEATVTIAGVTYAFPSFWNGALAPRNPLCRHDVDFDIVIVGRDL